MILNRVGKIAFALATVSAITVISLFAMLTVGLLGSGNSLFVDKLLAEMSVYIIPSVALTILYALIGIGFKAYAKLKRLEMPLISERLSFYEEIYRSSAFDDGVKDRFLGLTFRRKLLAVCSCQILSLGMVAIIDYLVFFCDYSINDIASAVGSMLGFILPVSIISIGLFTAGLMVSDAIGLRALSIVEGNINEAQNKDSGSTEKKPSFTSGAFLKFRKKFNAIRIARSVMLGISVGMAAGGIWLVLSKLAIIPFEPISAIFEGIGAALITGGLVFLFGGRSDKLLAEDLDSLFGLEERAKTMIAYMGESGEMTELQRQDAERAISRIPTSAYKFKGLWIFILTILISAAVLTVGILVKDMRGYVPPVEEIAFELSEIQEAGILELIQYVENSGMEREFSERIADELADLLDTLRVTETQKDMRAALAGSMAMIVDVTYESSNATEILNSLWDSRNIYFRHLAKALDTSAHGSAEWSNFAERITEYADLLLGGEEFSRDKLKEALSGMNDSIDTVLALSGVEENDEIYLAIASLFKNDKIGAVNLLKKIDSMSDSELRSAISDLFDNHAEKLFAAVLLNKNNAVAGEYVMTRLGSLFLVPVPEFERPDFVKNNASVDGSQNGDTEKDPENSDNQGGVGPGATYGSDDLVLDPITGETVKYGDLIDKYNAIMYERLEGDFYTEEQKQAIKKYFELLYSGLEKKEGK